MSNLIIIQHRKGGPGMRYFGMGPYLMPLNSLSKLQTLLNREAFWAKNRSKDKLRKMLANSTEIVSVWKNFKLIGFGRATSDNVYRAVLWDIIVSKKNQREGIGALVIKTLLKAKSIRNVEKIYLMSTKREDFYLKNDFEKVKSQKLLIHKNCHT